MKQSNWRTVGVLLGVAVLAGTVAHANISKERGKIVTTDWRKMEMDIEDQKGRVGTWKVKRDCPVRFTDKKSEFPNPTLSDLREPMYIYFMFEEGTNLIQDIEVREVGFDTSKGGPGAQQNALITNLDANIGHIEVDMGAGPQTFKVDPKGQLNAFKRGQKVTILIETRNGEEIVTLVKPRR